MREKRSGMYVESLRDTLRVHRGEVDRSALRQSSRHGNTYLVSVFLIKHNDSV